MNLESLVSDMMRINVLARLWHWTTDVGQHHLTYEQFLNQNETFTDSLVESSLGNDIAMSFDKVGVKDAMIEAYSLDKSRKEIENFRSRVSEFRASLDSNDKPSSPELVAILDDVVENASKTLYLLKLK